MRSPIPYILLIFLLTRGHIAHASAVTDAMTGLCRQIDRLNNCQTTIPVPYADITYGWVNFVKRNNCKSRISYGFGWTCVFGFDKSRIWLPTGAKIGFHHYSLCDLVTKAVPKLPQFLSRSTAYCKCFVPVLDTVADAASGSVAASKEVTSASATVLGIYADFNQCALTAAFDVQDNKARLTTGSGSLVTTGAVRIFTAAELDLSRYLQFAGAIAPCFFGGCQPETIREFFEKYLTDSENLMVTQIQATLKPWSDGFTTVESYFTSLVNSTADIGDTISSIQTQAAKLIDDFCPDTQTCLNNTLTDFKAQVESTLDLSKQFGELSNVVSGTLSDVRDLAEIANAASDAFEAIGDLGVETIVEKVVSGQFRSIDELAGALKAAQKLPSIVGDLQNKIPDVKNVLSEVTAKGPAFVDSIQHIFATNWLKDYEGDAAAADKISDQVFQVQKLFEQLIPSATNTWASMTYLAETFTSAGTSDPQVDLGVASYSRWTTGSFDSVCTTSKPCSFDIPVLKTTLSATCPNFYFCTQQYTIPFPNHHIPFVRLTVAEDSPLARIGSGIQGSTTSISWDGSKPTATRVASSSSPSTPSPTTDSATSTVSEMSTTEGGGSVEDQTSSASPDASSSTEVAITSSEEETASPPESTTDVPVDSAPTASQAVRRTITFGRRYHRRADDSDLGPAAISVTLPVSIPSGYYTNSAEAKAAATTLPTTAVFATTTADGQVTTTELTQETSGAPTATITAPDLPDVSSSAVTELNLFTDIQPTTLEEALTAYDEIGTVSVHTVDSTMSVTATASVATTHSSSDGRRQAGDLDSYSTILQWPSFYLTGGLVLIFMTHLG